jgi:hypothetical protein
LLIDDIDLMPENCVRLLLSLAKLVPNNRNGPAIVLSSSLDLTADPKGSALSQLVSLAHNTIRLPRLGPSEIRQYIERSLWIAGGTTRRLIASDAMKLLIARSGGTPGMTNRLMDAVLTAGFARGDWIITSKTVAGAMGPTAPRPRNREKAPPGMAGRVIQIGATGLLVLGAAVFLYKGLHDRFDRKTHTPPKAIAPAAPSAPSIGATHPAKPTAAAVPGDVTHPQQTSSAKPAATLSPALIAALLKRGDQSLGLGDVAAARLLYQRAADAGNAVASAAIGMTYDPNYVVPGQTPDPARAAEWYRKAVALGNPHAADLLKQLGPR